MRNQRDIFFFVLLHLIIWIAMILQSFHHSFLYELLLLDFSLFYFLLLGNRDAYRILIIMFFRAWFVFYPLCYIWWTGAFTLLCILNHCFTITCFRFLPICDLIRRVIFFQNALVRLRVFFLNLTNEKKKKTSSISTDVSSVLV